VTLNEISELAYRFVPGVAADARLYQDTSSAWWPAHEIGHFLVATARECRIRMFDLDRETDRFGDFGPHAGQTSSRLRYLISREAAAMSISQRLLRRAGHTKVADEEIDYTDPMALDCALEGWCQRAVQGLLCRNRIQRLPATYEGLERLLTWKAHTVSTTFYLTRSDAESGRNPQGGTSR